MAVLNAGHDVPLVITQPDRPKGRGLRMIATPVKTAALDAGLRVVEAGKISPDLIEELSVLQPDIIAVSAFGLFLPRKFRKAAKTACINVHPSLLPKYRGAAPVQWSIINGDTLTGVSIMHVASKLDAGGIILQETVTIEPMDTAETLMSRLALKGGSMLADAIALFEADKAETHAQDEDQVVWAGALTREHGEIDWTKTAVETRNLVRGVVPWPVAFTSLPDHRVMKIFPHVDVMDDTDLAPGEIAVINKRVVVGCGRGSVALGMVQLPGKKRVGARALLNGGALKAGMRLGK